jgi:hypothetical protein
MQFETGKPPETPNEPYRAAHISDERWCSAGPGFIRCGWSAATGRHQRCSCVTTSFKLVTGSALAIAWGTDGAVAAPSTAGAPSDMNLIYREATTANKSTHQHLHHIPRLLSPVHRNTASKKGSTVRCVKLQGYVHNMAQPSKHRQQLTRNKQATERPARKTLATC